MSAAEALSLQDLIRLALTRIEPVLTDWPQLAPAIPELVSVLDALAGQAEAELTFTRLALAAPPERLALLEPLLTGHAQFCEPALGLEWAAFEKRGLRAVSGRYQALQAHAWFLAVRSVLEAILRQIGALAELEQAQAEGLDFDPVPRSSTRFAMLAATRAELERLLELGPGVFGRQGVLARAQEVVGREVLPG